MLGAGYYLITSIYAQNIDYGTPLHQGLLCYLHLQLAPTWRECPIPHVRQQRAVIAAIREAATRQGCHRCQDVTSGELVESPMIFIGKSMVSGEDSRFKPLH